MRNIRKRHIYVIYGWGVFIDFFDGHLLHGRIALEALQRRRVQENFVTLAVFGLAKGCRCVPLMCTISTRWSRSWCCTSFLPRPLCPPNFAAPTCGSPSPWPYSTSLLIRAFSSWLHVDKLWNSPSWTARCKRCLTKTELYLARRAALPQGDQNPNPQQRCKIKTDIR